MGENTRFKIAFGILCLAFAVAVFVAVTLTIKG
jgi:hypothetical protein